ncbi:MAG: EthD family reductase [Caulobacter sp.]|nr:EthD family reductase [Caulobacter sp.]
MAIFSVLYPAREGAKFDHDYYAAVHIPMVRKGFEPTGLTDVKVLRGVPGPDGGPPPFVAMVHLTFRDAEALGASLGGPAAPAILADVAKFTDITPITQVSVAG